MKLIEDTISIPELQDMSQNFFEGLVKGVVDIQKRLLVLDAELHVDQEQFLLQQGSDQDDLWGINLYPELYGDEDFVEFDSMINVRPRAGNSSRSVENPEIQTKIREIISEKVTP
jgi:hypothetical protein